MKTANTNQKSNPAVNAGLTKVLGIGALKSLGFKANGQWIAQYTIADATVKNGNVWFLVHNCFTISSTFYILSS